MSIIKLVETVTQNRSPEIAHTKLPKWSLWDFIDVGKDRRLLASQRTKGKIFGRRSLTLITILMTADFHQLIHVVI